MPEDRSLFSMLGALLCILLILALAYGATRLVAGGGGRLSAPFLGGGRLKVLDQISLGREQKLLLAQALERYYLLGVSPGGITMLCELSAEEVESWEKTKAETERTVEKGGLTAAFGEELQRALRRKGRK